MRWLWGGKPTQGKQLFYALLKAANTIIKVATAFLMVATSWALAVHRPEQAACLRRRCLPWSVVTMLT